MSEPNGVLFSTARAAALFGLLAGVLPPGASAAVTITEFPLPSKSSQPDGITAGPDGALWIAEMKAHRIARMSLGGAVTEVAIPTAFSDPYDIAWGPDGALWFTEYSGQKIGRVTVGGVVREFAVPSSSSKTGLHGITAGPDGGLWFTQRQSHEIGRITTDGVLTEFSLPNDWPPPSPVGIAAGPDGNLWFTEQTRNRIGRITTAGVVTEFPIPTADSEPRGITAGPDGNLWFTEYGKNKIGRVTTAGVVTEFPIPSALSQPVDIAAGPDGALWFTEFRTGKIGRITTDGAITEMPLPTPASGPYAITAGPDGNLWFTEYNAGAVGRVELNDPGGTWLLPSSAYSRGANGEEYRTDVRILNPGTAAVTVNAKFFDQGTGQTKAASPFTVAAGNQAAFDNVLQSLFGGALGVWGPVEFRSTGPIVVSSSVNNVNACRSGGVSGQWLPGIDASRALWSGVLTQLALSTSSSSGYRTNVVFVNPGTVPTTVTATLRRGGGQAIGSQSIGPLPANGFRQVVLSSFPGANVVTDTNLWLEFTSDRPVLSFASVIHNGSGDPFAIVATPR